MTDDYVQVNVRMTREQRNELKETAEKAETSMNQYIIDRTFHSPNDRTDDRMKSDDDRMNDRTTESPIVELLQQELAKSENQLIKKDEQIEKLQKALDQQQQLTLQTNQQIERLQLSEPANSEKKKGLFSRWFGS